MVKTFHGDKMGTKDHCRIIHCTTGRIKAKNPAERLSFSFSKKANVENEFFFLLLFFLFFFFPFSSSPSYSSVPAVHFSNYYSIPLLERENVREGG